MSLYKIIADYRKHNSNKPCYYVEAESLKQAKKRFKNLISWLDIYYIEVCNSAETKKVLSEPNKHIIIMSDTDD